MNLFRSISIAALLLSFSAFAQPDHEPNQTDANGLKQGAWIKNWTSTGKVRYTGSFKDDKPTGEFRYFDEEGNLTSVMAFRPNGSAYSSHFHLDGSVMAKGKYNGRQKDSTWNYFNEAGQLIKTEIYQNKALNGPMVSYFSDGSVAEKQRFENGVQQGEWQQFYQDGLPRLRGTMVDGESEGLMTIFYANGKKEIEGKYVNGQRDGSWYYYHDDGSVQLQILYRQGEPVKSKKENGVFKDYYDDEQLKLEENWKNGKKEGAFTEYYNNGTWEMQDAPADERLGTGSPGKERVLKGQTKKREGTYQTGELHGLVKEYNEKGKLISEVEYADGVEVKK